MNKGFKIIMNKSNLKKLTNAQLLAVKRTASKLLSDKIEQQQIPFDEGTLQNIQSDVDDSALSKGNLKIYHQTPYSARLYFNPQYNFSKQMNPNAQGEWWEDYISGDRKEEPVRIYKAFLKLESGGVIH